MAQKAPIEKLEELADGFQALRRRFKSYHERLSQKITHGE